MGSFIPNIQDLSIQFVPFMMAVIFHEFAHGYIANKWGDPTAKDSGRLTLNPIPHIDLIGTIVFPIIIMVTGLNVLFGWAKPVPINPTRFRKYRPGLFLGVVCGTWDELHPRRSLSCRVLRDDPIRAA
jgi:Zn-dependent protease